MELLEGLIDLLLKLDIILRHRDAVILCREFVIERLHADSLALIDVVVVNRAIVDDGVYAACFELYKAVRRSVELSDRDALHLLDHLCAGRSDLNGALMPLEIAERLDVLLIAANDHRQTRLIVRIGEVDALLALVIDRHTADDDVDVLCLQCGNEPVKPNVLNLCFTAHLLRDRADEIHIEALIVLLSLILELKRRKVNRGAHAEYLALLLCLIVAAAAADEREAHESAGQDECQFLQFHWETSSYMVKNQRRDAAAMCSNPSIEGSKASSELLRNVLRASS